jgi:hypothetical protein
MASRSVHGGMPHKGVGVWVSVGRYALHRAVCKNGRWFVYFGFAK